MLETLIFTFRQVYKSLSEYNLNYKIMMTCIIAETSVQMFLTLLLFFIYIINVR